MNIKHYQRHTQLNQSRHDIAYEPLISALLDGDSHVFLYEINRTYTSAQELAARRRFITFLSNTSTGIFFTDTSLFSRLMVRIIETSKRMISSESSDVIWHLSKVKHRGAYADPNKREDFPHVLCAFLIHTAQEIVKCVKRKKNLRSLCRGASTYAKQIKTTRMDIEPPSQDELIGTSSQGTSPQDALIDTSPQDTLITSSGCTSSQDTLTMNVTSHVQCTNIDLSPSMIDGRDSIDTNRTVMAPTRFDRQKAAVVVRRWFRSVQVVKLSSLANKDKSMHVDMIPSFCDTSTSSYTNDSTVNHMICVNGSHLSPSMGKVCPFPHQVVGCVVLNPPPWPVPHYTICEDDLYRPLLAGVAYHPFEIVNPRYQAADSLLTFPCPPPWHDPTVYRMIFGILMIVILAWLWYLKLVVTITKRISRPSCFSIQMIRIRYHLSSAIWCIVKTILVSMMVSLQWWLEDVSVAAESLLPSNLPRPPPWPDPQVDLIHRTVGVDDL